MLGSAPPSLFFRHWRKLAIFYLLVLVGVAVAVYLGPRGYRSQAKLFLRLGRENVTLDPTATLGQTPVVAVPPNRENEINTVIDMLKSRMLLEWVVAKLSPATILGQAPVPVEAVAAGPMNRRSPWADDPPLPGDERYQATDQLARILDVEAVKRSNVIRVSCDGPSPEAAQAIVSTLIDLYLEQHIRLNRTPGAYQFLSEQTSRLREKLTSAEEELRKLKNTTGLSSPDAQRQVLVTHLGRLQEDLLQAEGSIAASEATTRHLRQKLAGLPETQVSAVTKGFPNSPADTRWGQVFALQSREKELSARYLERHPEVLEIRKQLAEVRALAEKAEGGSEQTTTTPSKLREETQLALLREEPVLVALKARASSLRDQVAKQRKRLEQFNEDQLRVTRLQRDVDLQEISYRKYAENLEQLQIDGALATEKLSNISIAQPATFDARTIRPRMLMTLGLGLLFAVAGSFGLVLLCEHLDPTPHKPDQVHRTLNLPTLATIPSPDHGQPAENGAGNP